MTYVTGQQCKLPAIMDLYHVEQLAHELKEATTLPVHIDVSHVNRMTTAGVQCLLSIKKTADLAHISLDLDTSAECLAASCSLLGLTLTTTV